MEIPRELRDAMVLHALEEDPNECCGLLAGKDGKVMKLYRITNAEKSPYRYKLDDAEYFAALREIQDAGWDIQVIYHSHTHSPAYPSDTDIRLVTWPDAYYAIVSLAEPDQQRQLVRKDPPELRVFRIVDGTATEEPVVIT